MYKEVWEAAVGEVLICEREPPTFLLTRAIACDGRHVDNDCLGSGRPSLGLKQLKVDIAN